MTNFLNVYYQDSHGDENLVTSTVVGYTTIDELFFGSNFDGIAAHDIRNIKVGTTGYDSTNLFAPALTSTGDFPHYYDYGTFGGKPGTTLTVSGGVMSLDGESYGHYGWVTTGGVSSVYVSLDIRCRTRAFHPTFMGYGRSGHLGSGSDEYELIDVGGAWGFGSNLFGEGPTVNAWESVKLRLEITSINETAIWVRPATSGGVTITEAFTWIAATPSTDSEGTPTFEVVTPVDLVGGENVMMLLEVETHGTGFQTNFQPYYFDNVSNRNKSFGESEFGIGFFNPHVSTTMCFVRLKDTVPSGSTLTTALKFADTGHIRALIITGVQTLNDPTDGSFAPLISWDELTSASPYLVDSSFYNTLDAQKDALLMYGSTIDSGLTFPVTPTGFSPDHTDSTTVDGQKYWRAWDIGETVVTGDFGGVWSGTDGFTDTAMLALGFKAAAASPPEPDVSSSMSLDFLEFRAKE